MEPEWEPVEQSLLTWLYLCLGFKYTVLLSLAGLFSFVLALIVVLRGRGPMAAAALVLIVPIPLLVGILGAIDGQIMAFEIISRSTTAPRPSEMAAGASMALVAPLVGLWLMAPGYAVAMFGSVVRSLNEASERKPRTFPSPPREHPETV